MFDCDEMVIASDTRKHSDEYADCEKYKFQDDYVNTFKLGNTSQTFNHIISVDNSWGPYYIVICENWHLLCH